MLPETSLTISAIQSALGTSDNAISDLNTNAGINKYSFYRPGTISVDANKNVILTADTSPYKMGDFRKYNHTAETPGVYSSVNMYYLPSDTTKDIILPVFLHELNVKEIYPSTELYFRVNLYNSSGDRTSKINSFYTSDQLVSYHSVTPPTGHTNDQTLAPDPLQLIACNSIDVTGLSTPDDTIYADIFIVNSAGAERIRLDDGYTDISCHEYSDPYIKKYAQSLSTAPSGYTAVWAELYTTNNGTVAEEITETVGTGTYTFYFALIGIKGSNYYRIGNVAITATLTIPGKTDTTVFNDTLNSAGSTSNQYCNGSLSGGQLWSLEDIGELVVDDPVSWTGFNEYLIS